MCVSAATTVFRSTSSMIKIHGCTYRPSGERTSISSCSHSMRTKRGSGVAGGGRYDSLLADAGAPAPVPAVGSCIHTERLLAVLAGGAP